MQKAKKTSLINGFYILKNATFTLHKTDFENFAISKDL